MLRYAELLLTLPVVLWAGADYYRRGWRGVAQPLAQHVHADRARRAGCVLLQPVRDFRARMLSRRKCATRTAWSASTSKSPRSSSRWCCWANGWSWRARGRTSLAIRQLLGLAPKTARRVRADGTEEDVAARSARCRRSRARASGREGAGGRAHRSKAAPRSMNPCSRASRCRSTRVRAIASSAPRSTRPAPSRDRASAWARTACCRRSSRWSRRRSAAARRCSAWPIASRRGSCRRSSSSRCSPSSSGG